MPKTKKNPNPSPPRRKRDQVTRKAPPLGKVIRGSLIERYLPCGKPGCHCHQKGEKGHGPHYYLVFNEGKKMRHVYIPQESREVVKRYVRNYLDLWEAILQVSALNLELLKRREL